LGPAVVGVTGMMSAVVDALTWWPISSLCRMHSPHPRY
jgi:hypothetical protein